MVINTLIIVIIIKYNNNVGQSKEIRREKGSLDVNSIWNRKKKIISMVTVITGVINNIS